MRGSARPTRCRIDDLHKARPEDRRIEPWTGRTAELVHPEVRRGRTGGVPAGLRSIDEIDIPGVDEKRKPERAPEGTEREARAVPEVARAGIGNGCGRAGDVALGASALGHPDGVDAHARIPVLAEHAVDFGGTPKATASGRSHEHE